jgi:hypothetical protein
MLMKPRNAAGEEQQAQGKFSSRTLNLADG